MGTKQRLCIKDLKRKLTNVVSITNIKYLYRQTHIRPNLKTSRQIISTLWFLIYILCANAQQTQLYSLQAYTPYGINPAYAGFDGSLSIAAVVRTQWNQITGNPISQHVESHLPLTTWPGGIGLTLDNESLGSWQQTKMALSYNYITQISDFVISTGGRLGWIQASLNGLDLRTPEGIYEGFSIDHQDVYVPLSNINSHHYTLDIGMYIVWNGIELGLSALYVNRPRFKLNTLGIDNARLRMSYNAIIRYGISLYESLDLTQSLIIRTNFVQQQIDGMISATYKKSVMFGLGFRGYTKNSADAVLLSIGSRLSNKLWFRYGFDLGISRLSGLGTGSHEMMLTYNLGKSLTKNKRNKIIYNPRFVD